MPGFATPNQVKNMKEEASEAMTNRLVECIVQFELDCCSSLQCEWMRAFERYGCLHLSDKNEKGNTMTRFFRNKSWIGNTLVKELFGYKVVLQRHAYRGNVQTGSKYWIRRRLDLERQYNTITSDRVATRSSESKSSCRSTRSSHETLDTHVLPSTQ